MTQRHKVSKSSGKMVSTYLLDAELPQTFNCIKKKKRQYLQNTIKQSTIKYVRTQIFFPFSLLSEKSLQIRWIEDRGTVTFAF